MRRPDPIPELKQHAAAELARLLAGWNTDDVAAMLRTGRSRISEIRRGKLDRFSLETLIRHLTRMGRTVQLRIDVYSHSAHSKGSRSSAEA